MSSWKHCISQVVGSERITDLNTYVSTNAVNNDSPIDQFYDERQNIVSLFSPSDLNTSNWKGALASIAIVSSIENYFRQIFSQILKICVDSQKLSANHSMNLGSVIWHPSNEVERGAFEHISLASAESINKTSKNYVGIDLRSNRLGAILDEYDKICELRHGIVHSGKVMAGKNGIKLKLNPVNDVTHVDVKFAQLQEIIAICNALVVDSNKLYFAALAKRWATTWRATPGWNASDANLKFKKIWTVFHSTRDEQNGLIANPMTWIKCRNQVKREFNI